MKIAMFTETFLPHANGVTTSVANARAELTRRGHEVTVFAAGKKTRTVSGVHYYGGYALTTYPDFPLAIYPNFTQPSSRAVMREGGIEMAHLHGPGPMGYRGYRAARALDLPYVYTYHTLLEPLTTYAPRGLRAVLRRVAVNFQAFLARRASRFIVPSRFLQQAVLREQPGLEGYCRVVPTGIDVNRFNPDIDGSVVRRRWGFGEDAEVLLYLGRLGFEKRIGFLLESFANLQEERPTARLVLAGSGPARDWFRRHARHLGVEDSVLFTGYVPDVEVAQFYRAADAFVSASNFETQGLTLLEAMACGMPSAVAAAGGYLDLVRDGENSYPFAPEDRTDAVRAMDLALDAPSSVRKAARTTALEYSLERCVSILEDTYEDVLNARAR